MNLDQLRAAIEPLRQSLLQHPLYDDLGHPQALRVFMQHHVFAVWDFMSLLKALQQRLCCVTVPWLPPVNSAGSRLINEIVLGEETDSDGRGSYCSHFDLYLRAMVRFNADTSAINQLMSGLRQGSTLPQALQPLSLPASVLQFLNQTFGTIERGNVCEIASAFTFGREDLLPGVFQRIVDELSRQADGGLDDFQFYLQRHIELDGDEHGPLAARLMISLCGDDPERWQLATRAAIHSLESRVVLWDGIHREICKLR